MRFIFLHDTQATYNRSLLYKHPKIGSLLTSCFFVVFVFFLVSFFISFFLRLLHRPRPCSWPGPAPPAPPEWGHRRDNTQSWAGRPGSCRQCCGPPGSSPSPTSGPPGWLWAQRGPGHTCSTSLLQPRRSSRTCSTARSRWWCTGPGCRSSRTGRAGTPRTWLMVEVVVVEECVSSGRIDRWVWA